MQMLVSNGTITVEVYFVLRNGGWAAFDDVMHVLAVVLGNGQSFVSASTCRTRSTNTRGKRDCYHVDMVFARQPEMANQVSAFRAAHDLLCGAWLG